MHKQLQGIGLALLIGFCFSSDAQIATAQQAKGKALRQGFPGRRVGAGTRDDVFSSSQPLTALTPDSNFGQTISANPSLQFYLPKTTAPKLVEFVVRDDQDQQVYKSTFLMRPEVAFTDIKMFAESGAMPLAMNQDYHWYFSIILDPQQRSKDIVVDGWIRRVETPKVLTHRLAKASPLEQAALYHQAGIWYEAIEILANLRRSEPNNPEVNAQWQALLESVGLEHISEASQMHAGL